MKTVKSKQAGFGVVEGLLAVIAVALVVFVVFYVVNQRDNKESDNAKPATTSSNNADLKSKNDTAVRPETPATASDEDQIISAVKSYTGAGASQKNATVAVKEIKGDNAQGRVNQAGADSNDPGLAASFIAHKSGGTWTVVFEGQQPPSKDIGTKYNLPADWYSTEY